MTSSTPIPSALAAKVTAMRWRSTGRARVSRPGRGGEPAVEQSPNGRASIRLLARAPARTGDPVGEAGAGLVLRPAARTGAVSSNQLSPIGIRHQPG